ncbi:MAG: CHAT domain-containing protein [Planctomycetes bacterium]|nr:CHAT domain-containing protein [Planctomycetota bacterium]
MPIVVLALLALLAGQAAGPAPNARRAPDPALLPGGALHDDLMAGFEAGSAALRSKDPAEARRHLTLAAERLEPVLRGTRDVELLGIAAGLATRAFEVGDLPAAERFYRALAEARARLQGPEHAETLKARSNLASAVHARGDRAAALEILEELLPIAQRTLPPDDPLVLGTRLNLATSRKLSGDLPGARSLLEELVADYERALPADHEHLLSARQTLAQVVHAQGHLKQALELQESLLGIWLRTRDPDDASVLTSRQDLAETLSSLGDLDGAHEQAVRALEGFERKLPPDHVQLLGARARVGVTKRLMGDLEGSRALLESVLSACERQGVPTHPLLSGARSNLASTLLDMGDLARARALLEIVLQEDALRLSPDDYQLLLSRQALASVLFLSGEQARARELLEAVVIDGQRILPEEHPHLLSARMNLASVLRSGGEVERAREIQQSVLEITQRTRPLDRFAILALCQNLAISLKSLGDLAAARAVEEATLAEYETLLPEHHPDLVIARNNLSTTLATERAHRRLAGEADSQLEADRVRIAELTRANVRARITQARLSALSASAREAEERGAVDESILSVVLGYVLPGRAWGSFPELAQDAFQVSESTRAAALAVSALRRAAAGSAEYAALRADLLRASRELASLGRSGGTAETYHAARAHREAIERQLAASARGLDQRAVGGFDLTLPELAARLGPQRVVVALRAVKLHDVRFEQAPEGAGPQRPRWDGERRLVAFVLRGGERGDEQGLRIIDLGRTDEIEQHVRAWRAALRVDTPRGLAASADATDPAREAGLRLRRAVWDPLLAEVAEAQRVVFVPDDVLHLVPLDALPLDEPGSCLGDRWRVETRLALWDLGRAPGPASTAGSLVALGGAAFNSAPAELDDEDHMAPAETSAARGAGSSLLRGGAWERGFSPLAHTGPEALEVAELHREVFGEEASALVLERRRASRAALESVAPRARWLHLATHGWFAPESVRSWTDAEPGTRSSLLAAQSSGEVVRGMSPMLLCGLALAGANLPADDAGHVPGLVTAEELSALDLSLCRLAVLSACETNVGERRAGQGVASLQKALHMAGAQSVVTSLWRVPDEATRALMLDFYRRLWVERKPAGQALWEAKRFLRNARDEQGAPRYAVRDWAAWVLSGDPG